MTSQLRIYRIKPGAMDDFLALWREHIVPAREPYGLGVSGAWASPDGAEFCWVVTFDGDAEAFADADARYYAGPERAALPRSPADFIDAMELRVLQPVAF